MRPSGITLSFANTSPSLSIVSSAIGGVLRQGKDMAVETHPSLRNKMCQIAASIQPSSLIKSPMLLFSAGNEVKTGYWLQEQSWTLPECGSPRSCVVASKGLSQQVRMPDLRRRMLSSPAATKISHCASRCSKAASSARQEQFCESVTYSTDLGLLHAQGRSSRSTATGHGEKPLLTKGSLQRVLVQCLS